VKDTGWVALLRGINLASRNRVPMAQLKQVFEETGAEKVRTYIASGNVLFTSRRSRRAALGRTLEQAVEERFGVAARVVLRTFDEIQDVAASHPFGRDASKTQVAFLDGKPSAAKVKALESLEIAPDRVHVAGSDAYLHYPNGVQGARLSGALLEKELGVAATVRNWRTVTKLAELARAE
jgi:uncharacterized protein (DUF1697 family)